MAPDIVNPEVRAYLLGALDEISAEALEARYIGDAALVEGMRGEEEALVDDYLADRLTAVDRARFEGHYLASPVHRDRVAVARALGDRLAATAPGPAVGPAFYGWMAMAAAIVLMSLWLAARPGPEPRQVQTPPAPSPAPPPVPAPAPSPGPSAARALFAITISPITTRSGAQPTHQPPAGPVDLAVRLEGAPEPTDRAYDAELQTADGRVAWRGRARPAAAGSGLLTTLRVPADGLQPDDYVIVVSAGREERGRYVLHLRAPRR